MYMIPHVFWTLFLQNSKCWKIINQLFSRFFHWRRSISSFKGLGWLFLQVWSNLWFAYKSCLAEEINNPFLIQSSSMRSRKLVFFTTQMLLYSLFIFYNLSVWLYKAMNRTDHTLNKLIYFNPRKIIFYFFVHQLYIVFTMTFFILFS